MNFSAARGFYLNYSIYEIATSPRSLSSIRSKHSGSYSLHIRLLSCVLNMEWIIELHWQQSMWRIEAKKKSLRREKESKRKQEFALRTHRHINSLMRGKSGLNVLVWFTMCFTTGVALLLLVVALKELLI